MESSSHAQPPIHLQPHPTNQLTHPPRPPKTSDRTLAPASPIFKIYGSKLHKVHIAYLSAGNGVRFEIFQFVDPPTISPSDTSFKFQQQGVFHIAITVPDTDDAVRRVLEAGGDQVGETIDVGREVDGGVIRAAYVRDPWGTVIEVLNVEFSHLMAMQMAAAGE
jgi:catechol 2,3-dioxygenase-like lactoylglutathione lyase family enzyme